MTFDILVTPGVNYGRPGKEYTQSFIEELSAELYISALGGSYRCTRLNFTQNFTSQQIEAEALRRGRLIREAGRLESWSKERTNNNLKNPESFPCEVCGKKHPNYNCCEKCNFNNHRCHFCGEELGHAEFSICYILEGLGE